MLNRVVLIGRLTKDPEHRSTPNGVSVTTFTLAVDRSYASRQGEREADFIPIVTWRTLADTCARYLKKGRLTAVSGRIQTRSYEGNDGQRRYVTEVVADEVRFLDRSETFGGSSNTFDRAGGYPDIPVNEPIDTGFQPIDEDDDELPF
ncbi:MAG TPA: single-stranded DNA-binding protein [Candidatus Atribacteria bacterium]|nr:single-stranded DNA-binding protein [Candidatus Atribacteria bacterium]HPT79219.1 single-stranded DNA-binding protein [Candidatus Atribacteria bacterium]